MLRIPFAENSTALSSECAQADKQECPNDSGTELLEPGIRVFRLGELS
jgi:hypothetical protein